MSFLLLDLLLLADRFLRAAARELGYENVPELRQETVQWLNSKSVAWQHPRAAPHAARCGAARWWWADSA